MSGQQFLILAVVTVAACARSRWLVHVLGQVPWFNTFLVIALPVAATIVGGLPIGRQRSGIATGPLD